jgi:hypothetical protein
MSPHYLGMQQAVLEAQELRQFCHHYGGLQNGERYAATNTEPAGASEAVLSRRPIAIHRIYLSRQIQLVQSLSPFCYNPRTRGGTYESDWR